MSIANIEKLKGSTRAKIRSTQTLSSFPQIISELLQNSLDAGALHVDIGLDCEEWTCWVRDDGSGISKIGLELLGKDDDGGRYNTSKIYAAAPVNAPSTFGFRGEALASAAELCCLEICSRTSTSRDTWSIILKGGKLLYKGPAVRWRRESPGTVVCIRDAFYNLPVRRLAHPSPSKTWELVRHEMETYAFVFPHVAFNLEDIQHAREPRSSKDRTFRIPKTSSILSSFKYLYGRALTEHVEEINASLGSIRIEGFISLFGAYSKAYQFLYINRHPITPCDLHRAIDSKFNASSFSKNALNEGGDTGLPRSTVRRSPRKSEKKPIYVLNITIPPSEIDNYLEPSKNIVHLENKSALLSFLSSTIYAFLSKHGFSPEFHYDEGQMIGGFSPSPRKRRKPNQEDSVDMALDSCSDLSRLSLHGDKKTGDTAQTITSLYTSTDAETRDVVWIDPNTSKKFIVNTRTGNSYPQAEPNSIRDEYSSEQVLTNDQTRRTISHRACSHGKGNSNGQSIPDWLSSALQYNQAYAITENKIPSLILPSGLEPIVSAPDSANNRQQDCHRSERQLLSQYFQTGALHSGSNGHTHRLTKNDLGHARIVSQVDRKFVACLLADKPGDIRGGCTDGEVIRESIAASSTLILIDQHAADERVRVERFLKELCLGYLHSQGDGGDTAKGVRTKELMPPRPILLTQHEALMLKESKEVQRAFRNWGFCISDLSDNNGIDGFYPVSRIESDSGYIQLSVESIPEVVSEKLLQGDELQDLIRAFLGQLQTDQHPATQTNMPWNGDEDEFYWVKALRWCPHALLDMINSKACRGAIMFNDSLSTEQCERLVYQLSQTAFPFQCAHGRPSLVPLANLGAVAGGNRRIEYNWTRLETIDRS